MRLESAVFQAVAPGGPYKVACWITRSGQLEMASEVATTLVQGGFLVVKAGTGAGRTYAYLVPAFRNAT